MNADRQITFWRRTVETLLCVVLGLLAGLALATGYLADLPDWLR